MFFNNTSTPVDDKHMQNFDGVLFVAANSFI